MNRHRQDSKGISEASSYLFFQNKKSRLKIALWYHRVCALASSDGRRTVGASPPFQLRTETDPVSDCCGL
jgi:hypothetical protein